MATKNAVQIVAGQLKTADGNSVDQKRSTGAEDVLVAIDRSGSMTAYETLFGSTRIQASQNAYETLLQASDLGITNYAVMLWDTQRELLTPLTGNFHILSGFGEFQTRGGTDMRLPIQWAIDNQLHRIILLSDGQTSYADEVRNLAWTCLELGIKIDTIGIGDHDVELMKFLAERTGGIYTAPKTGDDLVESFVQLETNNRLMLEHK